jgi:predicted component of type VI protein secretion system
MTPTSVLRDNKCACGLEKGTHDKQSPSFYPLFEEIEKLVNQIIEVKTKTRKIKKEVSDKCERRNKIKALKKARLQAEAALVEIVRREIKV